MVARRYTGLLKPVYSIRKSPALRSFRAATPPMTRDVAAIVSPAARNRRMYRRLWTNPLRISGRANAQTRSIDAPVARGKQGQYMVPCRDQIPETSTNRYSFRPVMWLCRARRSARCVFYHVVWLNYNRRRVARHPVYRALDLAQNQAIEPSVGPF